MQRLAAIHEVAEDMDVVRDVEISEIVRLGSLRHSELKAKLAGATFFDEVHLNPTKILMLHS